MPGRVGSGRAGCSRKWVQGVKTIIFSSMNHRPKMLRFRDTQLFFCPITPTGNSLARLAPLRFASLRCARNYIATNFRRGFVCMLNHRVGTESITTLVSLHPHYFCVKYQQIKIYYQNILMLVHSLCISIHFIFLCSFKKFIRPWLKK